MPEEKSSIRKNLLETRKLYSPALVFADSYKILKKLKVLLKEKSIRHLLLYFPTANEVDTRLMFPTFWEMGIATYLPKTNADNLDIHFFSEHTPLSIGRFGIIEPENTPEIDLSILQMALIPCVGADHHNNRLGYGKGYYDRFLSQLSLFSVGLCYDFARIEVIPTTNTDVPLSQIITPSTR